MVQQTLKNAYQHINWIQQYCYWILQKRLSCFTAYCNTAIRFSCCLFLTNSSALSSLLCYPCHKFIRKISYQLRLYQQLLAQFLLFHQQQQHPGMLLGSWNGNQIGNSKQPTTTLTMAMGMGIIIAPSFQQQFRIYINAFVGKEEESVIINPHLPPRRPPPSRRRSRSSSGRPYRAITTRISRPSIRRPSSESIAASASRRE